MNSISEKEIFRRLQLVRDTRIAYVEKYNLSDEEVRFRYDLLKHLDETEYIKVEVTNLRCIRYGKYEHTKVITNFDPAKDALLNRGEVQGYWGDSTTVSGNFETELGYLYVDEIFLQEDCSDETILELEKREFEELIDFNKYHINSSLPYKQKELEKLQSEIDNMKLRLKYFESIVIEWPQIWGSIEKIERRYKCLRKF